MSLIINTNISALTAQRNLTRAQSGLEKSIQRLSTGLRINGALTMPPAWRYPTA